MSLIHWSVKIAALYRDTLYIKLLISIISEVISYKKKNEICIQVKFKLWTHEIYFIDMEKKSYKMAYISWETVTGRPVSLSLHKYIYINQCTKTNKILSLCYTCPDIYFPKSEIKNKQQQYTQLRQHSTGSVTITNNYKPCDLQVSYSLEFHHKKSVGTITMPCDNWWLLYKASDLSRLHLLVFGFFTVYLFFYMESYIWYLQNIQLYLFHNSKMKIFW